MPQTVVLPGVEILAPVNESQSQILTPEAVAFIVDLQRTFNQRRKELLVARHERQKRLDAGEKPDFLAETKPIREADVDCRAAAQRYPRPPRRDHRSRGPQDDHQRAELGRQGLHGRF